MAVPYASGVKQVGDTVSFTLNEPADTVTITRNGGNTILLTAASSGSHAFDMNGFANYTISVTHSAPVGWAESVNSIGNPMLGFERANGVAVNTNPGSPNFGRFYVSQRDGTVSYAGRQMGDGIYVFNADATDAFGITDPNDANAARTAGLDFNGSDHSPFRLAVGEDDTLYISDASDIHGGMYYTDPDVTSGGNLLAGSGGIRPIVGQNHGSIMSTPLVTGSLADGDLVLYTIDQDLEGSVPDTGSHVWRYDIGDSPEYDGAPTLVVDASTLINADGANVLNDYNNGFDIDESIAVDADIAQDPRTGNFIINQRGRLPVMMDQSLTNILNIPYIHGLSRGPTYSPDGKVLALRSNGATLLYHVDEDGIPYSDGFVLNETMFYSPPGYEYGGPNPIPLRVPITYDLAGNIYTAGNASGSGPGGTGERLGIYGPGGDSSAITRSDGTFTINGTTYGDGYLAGDLTGDGFVGIEDLGIVLGNWNATVAHGVFTLGDPTGDGFVGIEDLNVILGNWNAGTPPSDVANIPEPGTVALLGLGTLSLLRRRNRA